MSDQRTPTAAVTPTPVAVTPTLTVRSPNSTERWTLPDLRAWDVERNQVLYVAESAPDTIRLLDLATGAETSVAAPPGRQVASALILRDGIGYLATVGEDRYRPLMYEIRIYDRETQRDQLIEAIAPAVEPGRSMPTGPGFIANDDGTTLVWSRFETGGDTFDTELRRYDAGEPSPTEVYRTGGVVYAMAVYGQHVVVWKRPAGGHGSPTATSTYLVTDGEERLLKDREWTVDVAADGRAVLHWGSTVEVWDGLTGSAQTRLALDSAAVPVIAGHRLAWCAHERGSVTVYDLDRRTSQEYTADGCAPRIHLDEASVTWLESHPGKFALVRLRLP